MPQSRVNSIPYSWNAEKVRNRGEEITPKAIKKHDEILQELDRQNDEKLK